MENSSVFQCMEQEFTTSLKEVDSQLYCFRFLLKHPSSNQKIVDISNKVFVTCNILNGFKHTLYHRDYANY